MFHLKVAIATTMVVGLVTIQAPADTWQSFNTTITPDIVVGSGDAAALLTWDPNLSDEVDDTAFIEYRWNTADSASLVLDDVLNDVNATSSRVGLFWHPDFDSDAESWALFGLGFDVDGDGLNLAPGIPQDAPGGFPGSEDGTSLDSDDWYREGWFTNGFWQAARSLDGETWDTSFVGIGVTSVDDGDWHGLSWAPGFAASTPTVPEPASLTLIGLGGLALLRRRRA